MAESARSRPQLCLNNTGRAPELAGVSPPSPRDSRCRPGAGWATGADTGAAPGDKVYPDRCQRPLCGPSCAASSGPPGALRLR